MPAIVSDTREQILMGCRKALARHGFRRMTMEDIAEAAGLAKRTLYLHFTNKEELVRATIDRVVEVARAAMAEAIQTAEDPVEGLRRGLIDRVMRRHEQTQLYQHNLEEVIHTLYPPSQEQQRHYFSFEVELVVQALDEAKRLGLVSRINSERASDVLIRATNSYIPSALSPDLALKQEEIREKLTLLVDLLLKGLMTKSDQTK